MHQEKPTREKMFDYQVFNPSSPKDKSLARELRAKANEIHLAYAKAQLKEAKKPKDKDSDRDKILQQVSNPSKFEEAIAYGLGLDFLDWEPRLDRAGVNKRGGGLVSKGYGTYVWVNLNMITQCIRKKRPGRRCLIIRYSTPLPQRTSRWPKSFMQRQMRSILQMQKRNSMKQKSQKTKTVTETRFCNKCPIHLSLKKQ